MIVEKSLTTSTSKSGGKIKDNAKSITIHGDAAIVFPLIIASIDDLYKS